MSEKKQIEVRRGTIIGLFGLWGDGDATLHCDDGTGERVRLSCKGPNVIHALEVFFGKVLGEPGEVPLLSPIDNRTGKHVGQQILFVRNGVDGSLRGFRAAENKEKVFVMPKARPDEPEDEEIGIALQRAIDVEPKSE